jgi:hypothetical protein
LHPAALGFISDDLCEKEFSMKTLIAFATAALLASSALAAEGTIAAPTVQRRALPPVSQAQVEGGIQRGVRLGNPAQMFNAFASQKYGDGREFVTAREEHDVGQRPQDNSRPQAVGLRLFSFSF